MTEMPKRGLYAITDPQLLPEEQLIAGVEAALRGGAVMVQYRDKQASTDIRRKRAESLLALCKHWNRPLIINDDLALALAVGADGVHLGQEDGDPARARHQLGPKAIIGVTCHQSMQLARDAQQSGASYVAFGRFFPSQTKEQAPAADLSVLRSARSLGLPVVAIGGISLNNADQALAAGADLLAVVNGLFATDDIETRSNRFHTLIYSHERESFDDPI